MAEERETKEQIEDNIEFIKIIVDDLKISQKYDREAIKLRKYYRLKQNVKPANFKKGKPDIYRAFMCAPANSFLEDALTVYKETTSFPLDFTLMTVMHLIGGYLLENNTTLHIKSKNRRGVETIGKPINPNLFSIFMGPSGCGKTRATYDLADQIGFKKSLLEFGSTGAGTYEQIEQNPSGTFYRDEFQEIIKQMNINPNAQEQVDIILKGYNGDDLQKITKTIKDQQKIEGYEELGKIKNPRFSFIGSCTFAGFQDAADDVMFQNGFFQRFNYIIAERETDKKRNSYISGSPKNRLNDEEILESWNTKIKNQTLKNQYFISAKACEFIDIIEGLSFLYFTTDRAYSARIRETLYKYTLIFHILRGKADNEDIELEDVFFALRLGMIHCNDLSKLFDKLGMSENEEKIARVRDFTEQFKNKNGREPKAYELAQRIRTIRNTEEALYLQNEIKNRDKITKQLENRN